MVCYPSIAPAIVADELLAALPVQVATGELRTGPDYRYH